jgi:hypothetical protein
MNSPLATSAAQIAALIHAAELDDKTSNPAGSGHFSIVALNLLPATDREQMLRARPGCVSMALAEDKPAKRAVDEAVGKLKALHEQNKQVQADHQDALHKRWDAKHRKLVGAAGKAILAGDPAALDVLESPEDIRTRHAVEVDAVHEAIRKIGHAQIPLLVTVGKAVDSALAALADRLEKRDLEDAKTFGILPEWATTTSHVQGCRVQWHRQVMANLKLLSALKPTAICSPCAWSLLRDFIDLSDWA